MIIKGDLVVMSIEIYEKLVGRFQLYKLIDEGIDAMEKKKVRPFKEAFDDIQKGL
ncbi:hypothetical protein [Clostridium sp. JN-1]|jgi:hypothetical protein|uniref:hypothetical protein n=1 Tax=Clostridium sp. JN-1 TaxID=2483110 RepID=UPI0016811B71|nr:hypothetical protein [Clostridium sp. JN-1]